MKLKILRCLIFLCFLLSMIIVCILVKKKIIILNKVFINKNSIIGVDISHHQGIVNMKKLKDQNISFIYLKATEGSSLTDNKFNENWHNAKQNNILVGAYHFFSYDSKGETQALNYINTVGDLYGSLIPVVDVEYYGNKHKNPPKKEDVVRELNAFLSILEERYKVKPMIYSREGIYNKYIKGEFDDYKKWISAIYFPLELSYKEDWYLWQYTDKGLLDGYNGREKYIDLNVLNKNKDINELIIK